MRSYNPENQKEIIPKFYSCQNICLLILVAMPGVSSLVSLLSLNLYSYEGTKISEIIIQNDNCSNQNIPIASFNEQYYIDKLSVSYNTRYRIFDPVLTQVEYQWVAVPVCLQTQSQNPNTFTSSEQSYLPFLYNFNTFNGFFTNTSRIYGYLTISTFLEYNNTNRPISFWYGYKNGTTNEIISYEQIGGNYALSDLISNITTRLEFTIDGLTDGNTLPFITAVIPKLNSELYNSKLSFSYIGLYAYMVPI